MKPVFLFIADMILAIYFIAVTGFTYRADDQRCGVEGSLLVTWEDTRNSNQPYIFNYDNAGRLVKCVIGNNGIYDYSYPDDRTVKVLLKELILNMQIDTSYITTTLAKDGKIIQSTIYRLTDTTTYRYRYNEAGKVAACVSLIRGYYGYALGKDNNTVYRHYYSGDEDSTSYIWRNGNLVRLEYYNCDIRSKAGYTFEYAENSSGAQHLNPYSEIEMNSLLLAGKTFYWPLQSRNLIKRIFYKNPGISGTGAGAYYAEEQIDSTRFDPNGRLTSFIHSGTDSSHNSHGGFLNQKVIFTYRCR